MTPLIAGPNEADTLDAEARSWLGTPYSADGAVKGSGASCSFPHLILAVVGHKSPQPPPRGTLGKSELLGAMTAWLNDQAAHFAPVATINDVQAGDVILVRIGMGHVMLALKGTTLIHSLQRGGVQLGDRRDPTFKQHFVGAWRPVHV